MKSKVPLLLGIIILLTLGGSAYFFFSSNAKQTYEANNCTFEIKTCPDGSGVTRVGKSCDFAKCPDEEKSSDIVSMTPETTPTISTTSLSTSSFQDFTKPIPNSQPTATKKTPPTVTPTTSFTSSIVSSVTSLFKAAVDTSSTKITSYFKNTPQEIPTNGVQINNYTVKDGKVISPDGTVLYEIPAEVLQSAGSSNPGWENSTVSVAAVGSVAPILNTIPVENLPGKYYLSENSFGNIENCEFSNRIYILDSTTNELTLMYEENSSTLTRDDPRACNSEIFLLATEGSKLILKYHTLKTSSLCDSAWSEPERTFYLDVTKLATEGMKKYEIPIVLSDGAQQEEEICRTNLIN